MNDLKDIYERYNVDYHEKWDISSAIQVLENIVKKHDGYFILKTDGDRPLNIYTFAINIPKPLDIIVRVDEHDIMNGLMSILLELSVQLK